MLTYPCTTHALEPFAWCSTCPYTTPIPSTFIYVEPIWPIVGHLPEGGLYGLGYPFLERS